MLTYRNCIPFVHVAGSIKLNRMIGDGDQIVIRPSLKGLKPRENRITVPFGQKWISKTI